MGQGSEGGWRVRGAYPPYFINLHKFVGVDKRTVYTKCGGVL